jgi:hypothetical protein
MSSRNDGARLSAERVPDLYLLVAPNRTGFLLSCVLGRAAFTGAMSVNCDDTASELERRLDGSRWMHWRNRILALERCETRPRVIVERPGKPRATAERSAAEKARARQRLLANRRRLSEAYAQLPNRPIWQAL